MTKIAFEIFQVITCTFGVTYNVNVRDTESLMINMVVSLAVYKHFFKFIQEFIVVVGDGISYIYTLVSSLNNFLYQCCIMILNKPLR